MPRARFQNAAPDKQEAILQAAAKEIAQNGYEGASVNRILLAAGMSKGAFYYYFDSKADLAAEVARWAYQDIMEVFERMAPAEDPDAFWDGIAAYSREGLAILRRSPYSTELMTRIGHAAARDKDLMSRIMTIFAKAASGFTELLRAGQKLGAVRADIPAEHLAGILQSVKEAVIRAYLPENQVPTDEEFERIVALQIDLYRRLSAPLKEESP